MVTPLPPGARVLVVRLGAIGDVTNALVFATALRERDPGVHIGWAVHRLAAPLVQGHPAIDRVHVWDRRGGLGAFRTLVRELRAARYDLAVDLQRILKSALLARSSGARRVLGFDRSRTKEASWLFTTERVPPGDPAAHRVAEYLEVAAALDARPGEVRHDLPVEPEAEAWAEALVGELGGAPILINLGASKPANRWPPERFGALARGLAEDPGGPVVLAGGPDDRASGERASAMAGAGIHDLVGATTLPQLVSLQRRARLFIGCDTGPMHLAAAVGLPVLALFGPADPSRTGPWEPRPGTRHVVLREPPPCAPCHRKTCNQPRHACMEDLTVERVLGVARARLAAPPAARAGSR
jgi:lipopolysaccharide heptosyltransferase II